MENKRSLFNGSIGFILAAAGSAVGLGNIWRFPYLAAKDGGGLFVIIYLILAVTFGFALLTAEISIGRKTKQGPLTAYSSLKKGWGWLGLLSCVIPAIIFPYYCVIGGWVLKYLAVYLQFKGEAAAASGYFSAYIGDSWQSVLTFFIFMCAVTFIVFCGVNGGIEKSSKIIMPALIVIVFVIAIFSLTISHQDEDGTVRTGLQGFRIYVVPDFTGLTVHKFLQVLVDAMGQLFYSLSIAMGIMIAYGSYVNDKANVVKSINMIEIFDTGVAFVVGIMIIPAVYTFMGKDALNASGPGLMFITLPKVFASMGSFGNFVGILFFAMVLFAALSSAVSVMEAVVSSLMDKFGLSRINATIIESVLGMVGGILVCLGYNRLYFECPLPNGSTGQLLDLMDYVSNSVLMPLVAIATCILVGWVLKPDMFVKEITKNGEHFGRKTLFVIMIKYVAPVMLTVLFLQSSGILHL